MAITSNGNRWLDDLPKGWETRLFKHKLRKITDGAHVSPDTSENAYPFVSTVDIENGGINFESCLQTSAESYSMLSSQGCRPKMGEVLFSKDGTVGRTALISFDKDFVVASSLIILTPQQAEVFPAFLDFMLRSHIVLEQINSFVKGSALKRVSLLNIKKVIGVFPPVEEQIRIASYLDKNCAVIDKAIEAKQKQLEILDALRKSIIHKAVTRGLDDSVELKASGMELIEGIPRHWDVRRIKSVAEIRYGLGQPPAQKDDGIPMVRATNVSVGKITDKDLIYIDPRELPPGRNPYLKEGEIIVVRSGAYTGDSAIIPKQYAGAVAGYDMVVTVTQAEPRFLAYSLLSDYVLNSQILLLTLRAAQPHLNAHELGGVRLSVPKTRAEQREICDYLDLKLAGLVRIKENIVAQISTLEQYRKSLIHECVTGKRRSAD